MREEYAYKYLHIAYMYVYMYEHRGRQNRQHHQQHIKLSQKPLKINEINCKINEKQAIAEKTKGSGQGRWYLTVQKTLRGV